jgi:hypothetical protein
MMRSVRIPIVILFTSLVLVGSTFLPGQEYAPTAPATRPGAAGPRAVALVACRMPTLAGARQDVIVWWAWNPARHAVYLASPAEGWAEVDGGRVVWSAQLEAVPARAWKQLGGTIPMPSLEEVPGGTIASGTFHADLPQPPKEFEARGMPLVLRAAWYDRPFPVRPSTLDEYHALLANQWIAISNPLLAYPFTSSAGPDASGGRAGAAGGPTGTAGGAPRLGGARL